MAVSELEIVIQWENDASFLMKMKEPDGEWKDVVSLEENAHISSIWDNIANVCNTTFKLKISEIGDVMKA